MDEQDLHYFENDFIKIVIQFVQSVVLPVKGFIHQEIFDFYVSFSRPNFIDEYEEEEIRNPKRLYDIEAAHYTICFLFDLL